jgi:hypothetical protein
MQRNLELGKRNRRGVGTKTYWERTGKRGCVCVMDKIVLMATGTSKQEIKWWYLCFGMRKGWIIIKRNHQTVNDLEGPT